MRGIIEERKDGTSRSGDPYVTYTIDGAKYSTFKLLDFQVGDEIEFTWKKSQDGKYKNLLTAEPYMPKPDQNEFIIREVAIKAAAETLKAGGLMDPVPDEVGAAHIVIKIAKEFEAYIKGDTEPEPEEDVPL